LDLAKEHDSDSTWHPECRVQAVPHDFTNPRWLLPEVEAWIAQKPEFRGLRSEWSRFIIQ